LPPNDPLGAVRHAHADAVAGDVGHRLAVGGDRGVRRLPRDRLRGAGVWIDGQNRADAVGILLAVHAEYRLYSHEDPSLGASISVRLCVGWIAGRLGSH